jgi:flagellar hook-associated protein 1 FlgK
MGLFTGLQIGLSGLQAQQVAQDVTGQNVANVNTPGYSRRKAMLVAAPPSQPYSVLPQPGNGVRVTGIQRSVDLLINRQIQRETSGLSYWQSTHDGMENVQGLFQELGDTGISTLTDKFWSSWHDLSTDPANSASRNNVRQAAENLTTNIRQTYADAQRQATQLDDQMKLQVQRVNVLSSAIADINKKITEAASMGDPANDLRDQRDVLVEDLSQLARVQATEGENGQMFIAMGGHTIVGAQGAVTMKTELGGDGDLHAYWDDDGSRVTANDGEMAATLKLRDWTRNTVMSGLDTFANQLISQVNAIHNTGYTADNRTKIDFLAGTGAANIDVSDTVKGDLTAIAVAAAPDSPGDGSLALKLADLQRTKIPALGDSIGGYYAAFTAQMGLDVSQADQMASTQQAVVNFLDAQRENVAGVSLDEEAVNQLSAQRAYQASARVITAVDQMLDKLINGTGVVGL